MSATKQAIQKLATMGSLPASLQSMLEAALREDEQHQGEPVAWRVGSQIFQQEHLAKMHSGGVRKPLEPLYTHADPEPRGAFAKCMQAMADRDAAHNREDALRAQLAEAHAALKAIREGCDNENSLGYIDMLAEDALSARAEPSAPSKVESLGAVFEQVLADNADDLILKPVAPVEIDERAEIKQALKAYEDHSGNHLLPKGIVKEQDWFVKGWQARAALGRKP